MVRKFLNPFFSGITNALYDKNLIIFMRKASIFTEENAVYYNIIELISKIFKNKNEVYLLNI